MCREHLGDVVNTTGALLQLRQLFPTAYIVAEVGERTVGVLENFPIDEVWARPTHQGLLGKLSFVRRLRKGRFDLCVMFDDSNVMVLLAKAAGIPDRVGVYKSKHRGFFTKSVPFDRSGHDIFDSLVGVMKLLGSDVPDIRPRLFLTEAEKVDVRGARVGLNVGASDRRKMWSEENWAVLADYLEGCCLVFGPGEEDLAQRIHDRSESKPPLILGLDSVLQTASALSQLQLLITADTGPAHLAAAMQTPTIVLYGPTDPRRFAPYGGLSTAIQGKFDCSLYEGVCASGPVCDQRCMDSIEPSEVLAAAIKVPKSKVSDHNEKPIWPTG